MEYLDFELILSAKFEVALRNAIDGLLVQTLGNDWLRDSVQDNGIFSNGRMNETRKIIDKAYSRLSRQGA